MLLLVAWAGGCSAGRDAVIGHSVLGVPLHASTVHSATGPRVYVIGLIHGDEPEGLAVLDAVRTAARGSNARLRVVADMNPDGRAASSRGNARGVDLNRNWPASNFQAAADRGPFPLSEPEARAVCDDLLRFRPDLLVVLHSIRRGGPFVNFDGPAPAAELAAAFAEAAAASDPRWRVVPDMGYRTPGSLGSFAGTDLMIPTLTIEFERGQAPDRAREAAGTGVRAVLDALASSGTLPYR
jgi:predicted deacylase